MLELNIYKTDNLKFPYIDFIIILTSTLIAILLFPDKFETIAVISALIFIVYFIMKDRIITNEYGILSLDFDHISIKKNGRLENIDLTKVDNLEFIYGGYKGKRFKRDLIPKYDVYSGIDNYIRYQKGNIYYEFNFFVENIEQEKELLRLIDTWRNSEINFNELRVDI